MDYLFVCLMFYVWFEDIYLIQSSHHYRKCAAKFRPLLTINGLSAREIHVDSNYVDNSGDATKIVAVISRAIAAKERQMANNNTSFLCPIMI